MKKENPKDSAETWHTQVAGIWHGCPSVYDSQGHYLGYIQADRKIFKDSDDNHLIQVATETHIPGPMGAKLHHPLHQLKVVHKDQKRVYEGPDFYGAGSPYGDLILGNDYCVPWASDNRVTVQLLPDGNAQAYSTVLYQGGAVHSVVCGIYLQSQDYDDNHETQKTIHHHRLQEIGIGRGANKLLEQRPNMLSGNLEVYDAQQNLQGQVQMKYAIESQDQYNKVVSYNAEGVVNLASRSNVQYRENCYFYHGPDLWGNGISYGRMAINHLYFTGENKHVRTREFFIPQTSSLAVVWEIFDADNLKSVIHGLLTAET